MKLIVPPVWLALADVWMMHRVRVTLCARVLRACGRAVAIQAPTCCSPFESSIGSRCPRSVREKRRGGACADHIIAIVQASIALRGYARGCRCQRTPRACMCCS